MSFAPRSRSFSLAIIKLMQYSSIFQCILFLYSTNSQGLWAVEFNCHCCKVPNCDIYCITEVETEVITEVFHKIQHNHRHCISFRCQMKCTARSVHYTQHDIRLEIILNIYFYSTATEYVRQLFVKEKLLFPNIHFRHLHLTYECAIFKYRAYGKYARVPLTEFWISLILSPNHWTNFTLSLAVKCSLLHAAAVFHWL